MRLYSDIHMMDVYKSFCGGEWVVMEKNDEEKMVGINLCSPTLPETLQRTIWKRNTDKIFCNRIQSGAQYGF
jgi:hypothetical protein